LLAGRKCLEIKDWMVVYAVPGERVSAWYFPAKWVKTGKIRIFQGRRLSLTRISKFYQ
jgi:hypothetical protein